MSHVKEVTTNTFQEEVLESSSPVLIDFWAPWCGPCRMLAPVLEKFAEEYAGKVKFVKVNIDENPSLAGTYKIRSIPFVLGFKNGKAVSQFLGYRPDLEVRKFIERLLR